MSCQLGYVGDAEGQELDRRVDGRRGGVGKGGGEKRGRRALKINKRKWLLCEQSPYPDDLQVTCEDSPCQCSRILDMIYFLIYLYGYWI